MENKLVLQTRVLLNYFVSKLQICHASTLNVLLSDVVSAPLYGEKTYVD